MLHSHLQEAAAKEGGMYRRIRKRTVVNIVCVCVLVRISWGEGEVGRTHAYNMTGRRPKLMSIRCGPIHGHIIPYHVLPRFLANNMPSIDLQNLVCVYV